MKWVLVPLDPDKTLDGLVASDPTDIRSHDLAYQSFCDGLPLISGEYVDRDGVDRIRTGNWSNLLDAVIAGYRLWREGRILEFEPSLDKLLPTYGQIDDLRVLDWLRGEARQEDGDQAALRLAGAQLPVVAAGMYELLERAPISWRPTQADPLVPGTLWTTFVKTSRPAPRSTRARSKKRVPIEQVQETWQTRVRSHLGLLAGGRFADNHWSVSERYAGLAVLIAPDCVISIGEALLRYWNFKALPVDTPAIFRVGDSSYTVIADVPLPPEVDEYPAHCVRLLRLSKPATQEPLEIASFLPRIGQEVVAILESHVAQGRVTAIRNGALGRPLAWLDHTCVINDSSGFPRDGAPILDLETGTLLAIHTGRSARLIPPLLSDETAAALFNMPVIDVLSTRRPYPTSTLRR